MVLTEKNKVYNDIPIFLKQVTKPCKYVSACAFMIMTMGSTNNYASC